MMNETTLTNTNEQGKEKGQKLYRSVWRWHFYAGLIFAPFMILLAIAISYQTFFNTIVI